MTHQQKSAPRVKPKEDDRSPRLSKPSDPTHRWQRPATAESGRAAGGALVSATQAPAPARAIPLAVEQPGTTAQRESSEDLRCRDFDAIREQVEKTLGAAFRYTLDTQDAHGSCNMAADPRILETALTGLALQGSVNDEAAASAVRRAKTWVAAARPQDHHPLAGVLEGALQNMLLQRDNALELSAFEFHAGVYSMRNLFLDTLAIYAGIPGLDEDRLYTEVEARFVQREEVGLKRWSEIEIVSLFTLLVARRRDHERAQEAARILVATQSPDGSFGPNPVSTAIAFMALNAVSPGSEPWARCREYLLCTQHADGTWRFCRSDGADIGYEGLSMLYSTRYPSNMHLRPRELLTVRRGESGILKIISEKVNQKDEGFVERGYKYINRKFDIDNCYQAVLSRTVDFSKSVEMPAEMFTSATILDLLMASRLSWRVKRRIIEFLCENHQDGLFSFFLDRELLPCDVDCTALALSVLMKANAVSRRFVHSAATKVFDNVDSRGIIQVYLPPRGEREGRVDPIPCANALYLAYLLNRRHEVQPTERYLIEILRTGAFLDPATFYYYLSPDVFIYWISRLLEFDGFTARYRELVEKAWRARAGMSESPLDLAFRIIAGQRLGLEDAQAKESLRMAQQQNGAWPVSPFYKLGRSNVYAGSEELVTAFALKALDSKCPTFIDDWERQFIAMETDEEMTKIVEFGMMKGVAEEGSELGERLQGFTLDFADFEKVRIPDILAPIGHDISPHLEEVRSQYIEWITDTKIVEPGTAKYDVLIGTKLDDLAAMMYPKHGKGMVLYGAIGLALFLLLDDIIDDIDSDRRKKREYIEKLEGLVKGVPVKPGENVILFAWQKWLEELRSYASPSVYEIFASALLRHVHGLKFQTLNNALCPTAHLIRRRDNIATPYFIPLSAIFLEREYGLNMQPVLQEHCVQNITELAVSATVIHNELLGLYKDIKCGEHNLIILMHKKYGMSLQDACNLAGHMADDMVAAMLQLERELPELVDGYSGNQEAVSRYIHTGYSIIRGALDWYTISMRYHQKLFFSVGLATD